MSVGLASTKHTDTRHRARLFLACLLILAGIANLNLSAPAKALAPMNADDGIQVIVRGLGRVPREQLELACEIARDFTARIGGGRCRVEAAVKGLDHRRHFDAKRGQYDARAVLEQLFRQRVRTRASQPELEMWLTAEDAFEGGRPYVFGLASVTDRTALISTARIAGPRLAPRLARLIHHELGHALGLPHDHDRTCVMRTDADVASLDTAPLHACARCHARLEQAHDQMMRPGDALRTLARGHAARGEWSRAKVLLGQLRTWADPQVIADLYLEAGPMLGAGPQP